MRELALMGGQWSRSSLLRVKNPIIPRSIPIAAALLCSALTSGTCSIIQFRVHVHNTDVLNTCSIVCVQRGSSGGVAEAGVSQRDDPRPVLRAVELRGELRLRGRAAQSHAPRGHPLLASVRSRGPTTAEHPGRVLIATSSHNFSTVINFHGIVL